jgi:hypothetical protein
LGPRRCEEASPSRSGHLLRTRQFSRNTRTGCDHVLAARSPLSYSHVAATPLCSRGASAPSLHSTVSIDTSPFVLCPAGVPRVHAGRLDGVDTISPAIARVPGSCSSRPESRQSSDASTSDQETRWCRFPHHARRFSSSVTSSPGITKPLPTCLQTHRRGSRSFCSGRSGWQGSDPSRMARSGHGIPRFALR